MRKSNKYQIWAIKGWIEQITSKFRPLTVGFRQLKSVLKLFNGELCIWYRSLQVVKEWIIKTLFICYQMNYQSFFTLYPSLTLYSPNSDIICSSSTLHSPNFDIICSSSPLHSPNFDIIYSSSPLHNPNSDIIYLNSPLLSPNFNIICSSSPLQEPTFR